MTTYPDNALKEDLRSNLKQLETERDRLRQNVRQGPNGAYQPVESDVEKLLDLTDTIIDAGLLFSKQKAAEEALEYATRAEQDVNDEISETRLQRMRTTLKEVQENLELLTAH